MKIAVYLREDQWSLVDDFLREAARIIVNEAEANKSMMAQLQPPSRVALRWCDGRISEIRDEIIRRRAAARKVVIGETS